MGVPIRYNLRNLLRRRLRTFLTIFGITLVVGAAVIMLAYSRGLMYSMRNNGDPENVFVLSRRATDHEHSSFKAAQFDYLGAELGDRVVYQEVAPPEEEGDEPETVDLITPYISHSFHLKLEREAGQDIKRRALIQGVDPERAAFMHEEFRITEGRMLTLDDERAAVVGPLAYARLGLEPQDIHVGQVLVFKELEWEIVGLFEASGTAAEGEIWIPIEELMSVLNRVDYSYAVVKAADAKGAADIVDFVNRSDRTELRAVAEVDYYRGYSETFRTFAFIGVFMALVITIGGVMVGMNTMYTAVAGRIREVGMLQVQGFSKRSILWSFVLESLVISTLGGVLGCALGSLVNGMPMTVTMGVFLFRVDTLVVAIGMALALFIGLVGAFVPARRAVRMRMVEAMRYA